VLFSPAFEVGHVVLLVDVHGSVGESQSYLEAQVLRAEADVFDLFFGLLAVLEGEFVLDFSVSFLENRHFFPDFEGLIVGTRDDNRPELRVSPDDLQDRGHMVILGHFLLLIIIIRVPDAIEDLIFLDPVASVGVLVIDEDSLVARAGGYPLPEVVEADVVDVVLMV
jgi:hypothetical protein